MFSHSFTFLYFALFKHSFFATFLCIRAGYKEYILLCYFFTCHDPCLTPPPPSPPPPSCMILFHLPTKCTKCSSQLFLYKLIKSLSVFINFLEVIMMRPINTLFNPEQLTTSYPCKCANKTMNVFLWLFSIDRGTDVQHVLKENQTTSQACLTKGSQSTHIVMFAKMYKLNQTAAHTCTLFNLMDPK